MNTLSYLKKFSSLFRKVKTPAEEAPASDSEGWVSWDSHPWKHPWLSTKNLRRIKSFSEEFLDREKLASHNLETGLNVGFCGNMANSLYMRARPLRNSGLQCSIWLHSQDHYPMSHPAWEESSLSLSEEQQVFDIATLSENGLELSLVDNVFQLKEDPHWAANLTRSDGWIRDGDIDRFSPYFTQLPTLRALQKYDVLWGATHGAYLAYLANRPYVVTQTGGDLWFEAARNDTLGRLMREAFGRSRIILASNPWTFAHARRYGFENLVYLPLTFDESLYSPGLGQARNEWLESGGSFFVLSSSRLDERNKGTSIGIEGFAEFAATYPQARLVLIGWGANSTNMKNLADKLGIGDKLIMLPLAAKGKLRDYLRSADVFLDQFVLGYYGSACLEALACGLPVIGRVETEQYEALCETGAPPIMNANTPESVARHLKALITDQQYKNRLHEESRDWAVRNHGAKRWEKEIKAVLSATAAKFPADFDGSPLRENLSPAEIDYHLQGLASAPPFPSYGW